MRPTLQDGRHEDRQPLVSVIVPARNEEASLAACLRSLIAQGHVEKELIVVDDGSTDATRTIAAGFPGVRVIAADPLLPGYSGKCNAAQTGARAAGGEWLLFTDADTVHEPGSLARALEEAREHGVELLSYSPRQEVHGLWEKAVMPVIFAELAATYRAHEINDAASPAAAANGQYLMIRREAYEAIGGHAAVRHTLLEDVALAGLVKRSGGKIRFRFAGEAVRTRMYRSFSQLCEGWTKNLALLFPESPRLAVRRGLEFLAMTLGPAVAVVAASQRRADWLLIAVAITGATALGFFLRIRRAHFGWVENLLSPVGLPIFVALLLRSAWKYRMGKTVSWKGREYAAHPPSTALPEPLSMGATACPAPVRHYKG